MTASAFLLFVLLTMCAVLASAVKYLPRPTSTVVLVGLPTWLVYVGLMSYYGVVRNPALRLPGILYILLPVFLFVGLGLIRAQEGLKAALAFPLGLLIAFHVYRIGVELFLHQLWHNGLVPQMLTYKGSNVDILVGLSAPIVTWIATRGRGGLKLALAWNCLGLVCLANTALRFAMTAPGPGQLLHTEIPNLAAGKFPYTFIPGFFAPLAVILHVLCIRAIAYRLRQGVPSITAPRRKCDPDCK